MPRDTSHDGKRNRLRNWVLTSGKPIWKIVNRVPVVHAPLNRFMLNNAISLGRTRPHPFSTMCDYTSVDSLRDKSYFSRHLPAVEQKDRPPVKDVLALFSRRGPATKSAKSTMLFATFAEWFTDGFLLTDLNHPDRNHSPHEIDLSQLYGLTPEVTNALRTKSEAPGQRGRLKTQVIRGEHFPPFLYDREGNRLPEFEALPAPVGGSLIQGDAAKLHSMFAFGGERTNSTPQTSMINILMLREHNRVCGELVAAYRDWDDERVFQTARNIMVVLLLRVVIDEYINHISPYHHAFKLDPKVSWRAHWNRPNWFAVEFNMLYRWHSLIPDEIEWGERTYDVKHWFLDNRALLESGLALAFDASSRQAAGEIMLGNTHESLLHTEERAIAQGRKNRLASYNDYRVAMRYPRVNAFEQITSNPEILARLKKVYKTVDDIEFYVGLFAEEPRPNGAVPALLGRMVALDAFSQALNNPLCSEHIFNEGTFSKVGLQIIESTATLADLVTRNVHDGKHVLVTMTQVQGTQRAAKRTAKPIQIAAE
jgi:prostaglandin-endoperoxide synthase 2